MTANFGDYDQRKFQRWPQTNLIYFWAIFNRKLSRAYSLLLHFIGYKNYFYRVRTKIQGNLGHVILLRFLERNKGDVDTSIYPYEITKAAPLASPRGGKISRFWFL